MDSGLLFIIFIIGVALLFDAVNGMHDAANSIATAVSTRALSPRAAVVWAAFFNFVAFLIFGTAVAKTIGSGLIDVKIVTPTMILAGLLGAIIWDMVTWYVGLPTSSSHALIGGYAGAAVAKAGTAAIIINGWYKTLLFIVLAPLIGLFLGALMVIITTWLTHNRSSSLMSRYARYLQLVSAAFYSLGHGGNDAQKTMGIIASLLFSAGLISKFAIPFWVVIAAHLAISIGTLTGGWRIIRTMGQKITPLKPHEGFCAETASAATLFFATGLGIPVSTTHVITGAISGVGATKRLSAVRWGITIQIIWAWILTIPLSAAIAYISYLLLV